MDETGNLRPRPRILSKIAALALLAALCPLGAVSCASFMLNPDLAATRKAPSSSGEAWRKAETAAPRATVAERRAPAKTVSRVREITVSSPRVSPSLDGYRIVFVSDIHFMNRYSRARLDALVGEINAAKPDAVIHGGDFTLSGANAGEFAEAASNIRAGEGSYATLGNHDFYNGKNRVVAALRSAGIVVLDGSAIETPRALAIAGVGDLRDEIPDLKSLADALPPESFAILSCHNPDLAGKLDREDLARFDLILCGHTHGGQITVLGFAPVIPSEYGQRYRTGTIFERGVPVIVSNGAGYSGKRFRFRFCAPSDFLVITLRRSSPTNSR
jgi:predicted MPP superfamily phosphohydrolase